MLVSALQSLAPWQGTVSAVLSQASPGLQRPLHPSTVHVCVWAHQSSLLRAQCCSPKPPRYVGHGQYKNGFELLFTDVAPCPAPGVDCPSCRSPVACMWCLAGGVPLHTQEPLHIWAAQAGGPRWPGCAGDRWCCGTGAAGRARQHTAPSPVRCSRPMGCCFPTPLLLYVVLLTGDFIKRPCLRPMRVCGVGAAPWSWCSSQDWGGMR